MSYKGFQDSHRLHRLQDEAYNLMRRIQMMARDDPDTFDHYEYLLRKVTESLSDLLHETYVKSARYYYADWTKDVPPWSRPSGYSETRGQYQDMYGRTHSRPEDTPPPYWRDAETDADRWREIFNTIRDTVGVSNPNDGKQPIRDKIKKLRALAASTIFDGERSNCLDAIAKLEAQL